MRHPLLAPIIAFLLGIAAMRMHPFAWQNSGVFLVAVLFVVLLSALVLIRKTLPFYVLLCLAFFFLGAVRCHDHMEASAARIPVGFSSAPLIAVIHGTIVDDPEWKMSHYGRQLVFPLKTDKITIDGREQAWSTGVLVRSRVSSDILRTGDEIVACGDLSEPRSNGNPAGFDYRAYLNVKGINFVMYSGKGDFCERTGRAGSLFLAFKRELYGIRKTCSTAFDKYLSGDTRSIVKPLILGTRAETSGRLKRLFIMTGTMHIIAVSGLHVTFVAVTILGLLRVFMCPRKPAYFVTIVFVCAYAVFTGCQPSAIRAALMGSFMLASLAAERKTALLDALALSAFLITFFAPYQLFDPGFILSYAALVSIIYVVPVTDSLFIPGTRKRPLSPFPRITAYAIRSFSLSLGAWIGMMPILAAYFRIITPSCVIANLIAVPLFYAVMLFGFILGITGPFLFLGPLSSVIARVLDAALSFYIAALSRIAALPLSSFKVPSLGVFFFLVYYAMLAAAIILFFRSSKKKNLAAIFFLFAAVLFVWNEVSRWQEERPRVTFFDVGKADAALVEFRGKAFLIDGGPGGEDGAGGAGENVIGPYLLERGIRRIDPVLLSHAHEDHAGGLSYILENFTIGSWLDHVEGIDLAENAQGKKLLDRVAVSKIKRHELLKGDVVSFSGGMKGQVFNPSEESTRDANDDSIVIKLVTPKKRSILFCGDAGSQAMKSMLCYGELLNSDIVKIPHHGSGLGDMAVVSEFLGFVKPRYAVITAKARGEVNRELLNILARMGTQVFITGECGAVIAEEEPGGWVVRGIPH